MKTIITAAAAIAFLFSCGPTPGEIKKMQDEALQTLDSVNAAAKNKSGASRLMADSLGRTAKAGLPDSAR